MKKVQCIPSLPNLGLVFPLLLLCACATTRHPDLPAAVTFNEDAGLGEFLIVPVRLESGEELPFMVDTGCPRTTFHKSLEPKLGRRLRTVPVMTWEKQAMEGVYRAPKLYLGNTRLKKSAPNILTGEVSDEGERDSALGILGLDVLEHYCIQLDFKSRKMRFLATNEVRPAKLGKAFPLNFSTRVSELEGHPTVDEPPLTGGARTNVIIDTGYNMDGSVPPDVFAKISEEHVDVASLKLDGSKDAFVEKCIWNGQTYTNLVFINGPNLIGLRFLARHLVTFDFPNRTMYLKQTNIGPLANKKLDAARDAAADSAEKALWRFVDKGQLPGWVKSDQSLPGSKYCEVGTLNCVTINLQKKGDASFHHYEFTRESKKSPWKLRKAWRTDKDDQTLETYVVPESVGGP